MERFGVIERTPSPSGKGSWYELTAMGQELGAVCDAMGQWGAKWLEIQPRHLEPAYVLWATTKLVDVDRMPDRTTTVRFALRDRPGESYWMILRRPRPELCTRGTGYIEDIVCRTDAATLVDLHLRRTTFADAMRDDLLHLDGPTDLVRQFSTWFRNSPFADFVPDRPEPHASADNPPA